MARLFSDTDIHPNPVVVFDLFKDYSDIYMLNVLCLIFGISLQEWTNHKFIRQPHQANKGSSVLP